jgi:predicted Zn finger-like uncharacterized protein
MNVSCPDCRSIFRVDPAKVPPTGVRARCSVCSGVIPIPAPSGQTTPTGSTARSVTSGSEAPPPERARPAQSRGWEAPPPAGAPPPAAAPPLRTEVPSTSRPRTEAGERPAPAATATPPSPSTGLPEFTPAPPAPPPPRPTPAPRPAPAAPTPPAAPFVPSGAPSRAQAPTPPRAASPPPPPRPPATPPSVPQTAADSGARRPLNPFLSKDPDQRAKRLARALVSDIITYHPAKHAEGLRDGTLKQLFREEIKKSFEEYIAQVGQQLAESTTYFQEALNEVLGAGKKIF